MSKNLQICLPVTSNNFMFFKSLLWVLAPVLIKHNVLYAPLTLCLERHFCGEIKAVKVSYGRKLFDVNIQGNFYTGGRLLYRL